MDDCASPVSPFAVQCLHAHNEYRKLHGSSMLRLDSKLNDYAQKWANELARTDQMQHNPARRYGENVYACRGFEPTGQQVVRTWYDEIKDYNFEQAQFSPQTGHFTAVIWSGTRLLGVGCARSIESGRIFVVANYDPSGNVIGHFEQNVLRPSGNQQCLAKKPAVSVSEMGEQCLRAHNAYRSLHGVPALRLNDDLSAYAQKHANLLAAQNRLQHNPDDRYGENIFSCRGFEPTGNQIVKAWYDECKTYNFDEARFNPNTGHFTAVIWLATQQLGIGLARSETTGQIYVVVNYDPPGNVPGQFEQNVVRIGDKPKAPVSNDEFAEQCLEAHNEFRAQHSTPALRLDTKLCAHAQKWAEEMASQNQMRHNPDRRYGENVYACRGFEPTGRQTVTAWYDEWKHYDFEKAQFTPAAGHFTSVVWYVSRLLGIGRAQSCTTGQIYIVANYDPPGNVLGRFAQNVLRPGGGIAPSRSSVLQSIESFAQQCLLAHNDLRRKHAAPSLQLDAKICAHAQKWADELASSNRIRPNPDRRYGENIYTSIGAEPSADGSVRVWYNEIDQYDFQQAGFSPSTGHFTALVWLTTQRMGVGLARNAATGRTCIVVNYDPIGNVSGLFERNVLPKGADYRPSVQPQAQFIALSTDELAEQCLKVHNMLRKRHRARALRLDNRISEYAQNWANQLAKECRMYHNPEKRYGENIFTCRGYDPTAEQIVLLWYNEIKEYSYEKSLFSPETGHFSAVVWRGTLHLGIGMSRNATTGQLYVVANYDPPGNVLGQFEENVLRDQSLELNESSNTEEQINRITKQSKECITETPIAVIGPKIVQSRKVSSESNKSKSDNQINEIPNVPTTESTKTTEQITEGPISIINLPSSPDHAIEETLTSNFAEQCLKAHNEYRQEHGASALQLDPKICEFAQNWANKLALSNEFQHNPDRRYGENIYSCSGSVLTASDVVRFWYDEIKDYNFENAVFTHETGHFTALVWCASRLLGVGVARSKTGQTYVVANYAPNGNVIGRFAQNVMRKGTKAAPELMQILPMAATTAKTASAPVDEFTADLLLVHNKYRKKHSAPALKLDKKINESAQKWANELAKAGKPITNPDRRYGENVFSFSGYDPTAEDVVSKWYEQIKDYSFEKSVYVPKTGNFTALVWCGSNLLGVGVKKDPKSGMTFIVAHYDPPGNVMGQFAENVLREGSKAPVPKAPPSTKPLPIAEFQSQCLRAHNEYRQKHSAPPLELDPELCKHAQNWAKHIAAKDDIASNPDNRYGENICWSTGVQMTGDRLIGDWYKEKTKYDFSSAQYSDAARHFTSIVWCNTRRLGVGVAYNEKSGGTFVVINYDPPGNRNGLFDRNVLREGSAPIAAVSSINILTPEFAQRCLTVTNDYRQKHGAPPLVLDAAISEYAQKWAHVNAREDRMYHNPEHRYGENLFTCLGFDATADKAVFEWYDEIRMYSFEKPGFALATGHFTALIWCGTERMGVGMARNGCTGQLYLVCNYLPAGNVKGQFEKCVLRAKSK